MKYSKSLDLMIAALTFGSRGDMVKAATCFDKALAMKDLQPTLAALESSQAAAHSALVASFKTAKPSMSQIMAALAKKRKAALSAKPAFPGAAPPFKKKSESEAEDDEDFSDAEDEEDEEDEEDTVTEAGFKDYSPDKKARYLLNHPKSKWHPENRKKKKKAKAAFEDESFDDIADDMTVSNGDADDDTPANGLFGGGMSAADAEGDDFDLDDLDTDVIEMPEAAADDGEDEGDDEEEEEDDDEEDDDAEDKDEEEATARVKRVQANLRSLARLTKKSS